MTFSMPLQMHCKKGIREMFFNNSLYIYTLFHHLSLLRVSSSQQSTESLNELASYLDTWPGAQTSQNIRARVNALAHAFTRARLFCEATPGGSFQKERRWLREGCVATHKPLNTERYPASFNSVTTSFQPI